MSVAFNDFIHDLQHLISQPATRRSTSFAATTMGFTIVELLIVIVVIGILVTIVIVAFTGIQRTAYNSAIESDLASLKKQYEILKIRSTDGLYPAPSSLTATSGIKLSKDAYMHDRNNGYFCTNSTRTEYGFGAISKAGQSYYLEGPSGTVTKESVSDAILRAKMGTGAICQAALSDNPPTTVNQWRAWAG